MTSTVLFAVSMHGYGHLAQIGPVIEALHSARPDIRIALASSASRTLLGTFIHCPFTAIRIEQDVNVAMQGPLDVDVPRSFERYRQWHRHYPRHERQLSDVLESVGPALVVSNIGYTILTAAARRRIPALAMSSINWADVLQAYGHDLPGMDELYEEILAAYDHASLFVQLTPCMPMPRLQRTTRVGPVARLGCGRGTELCRQLGLDPGTRLVLFSFGGIPLDMAAARWSVPDNSHWIVPDNLQVVGRQFTRLTATGMNYIDVLSSVDVLISKPGYGSFVEAASAGVSVIYVERGDWPEEPALIEWLQQQGRAVRLDRSDLRAGDFRPAFARLDRLPPPRPVAPSGIAQAKNLILETLRGQSCVSG